MTFLTKFIVVVYKFLDVFALFVVVGWLYDILN